MKKYTEEAIEWIRKQVQMYDEEEEKVKDEKTHERGERKVPDVVG